MQKLLTFLAVFIFSTAVVHAAVAAGDKAPDFSLATATGETVQLSSLKGSTVVIEWINFDCPFVKKHYASDNMQTLQQDWKKEGVVWISVCSSAPGKQGYFAGDELTKRMNKEKWGGTHYAIDADGAVGKAYGATNTPQFAIVNPEGVVSYTGAIDSIASFKPSDIKSSTNYVQEALGNIIKGLPVPTASTKPYGCSIKY